MSLRASSLSGWSPQPVTHTYQWLRNGRTLVGTDSTYRVRPADVGARIRVKVTGAADDFAPVSRESASSSSKVAMASFSKKGTATITAVGTVRTANEGAWSPSPDSYRYQWYRKGKALSKIIAKTYDRGTTAGDFKVKVAVIKAGYSAASTYSAVTKD